METENSGYFRTRRNPDVAWVIVGYPRIWEPATYLATDAEGNEFEEESDVDGEWVDDSDSGRVVAVMVGDDHKTTMDRDDLIPLDRAEFCGECGQIGHCRQPFGTLGEVTASWKIPKSPVMMIPSSIAPTAENAEAWPAKELITK